MRPQAEERLLREWSEDLPMIIAGIDPMDLPDDDPNKRRYRDEWALTGYGPPLPQAPKQRPVPTMRAIMSLVCALSQISPATLRSDRRRQYYARRRFLIVHLIDRLCPQRTTMQIADFLHKDHSTVSHARTKMPALLEQDPELKYEHDTCCQHFGVDP